MSRDIKEILSVRDSFIAALEEQIKKQEELIRTQEKLIQTLERHNEELTGLLDQILNP